jgi:DNA-binding NtrC family response regulator
LFVDGAPALRVRPFLHPSLTLIADSQEARRLSVIAALAQIGCEVHAVPRLERIAHDTRLLRPNLVIIGFSADASAIAFAAIAELQTRHPRLPIVVIVSAGSEAVAVSAFRAGVKDYFCDPLDHAGVVASARRWLAAGEHNRSADRVSDGPPATTVSLIATNGPMRHIADYLGRVAESDSTVLITGETGTGKELAATLVHERSRRRAARFVTMNCAAIPDGLLESELFGHESGAFTGATGRREGLLQVAERGTVFLDEIGDMGAQAQAKILRAIESREVYRLGATRPVRLDVRVIAATNQDLERAVEEGRFRKDLYFRLNVARVHLPPLRERRSDIRELLDHYLQVLNRERGAAVEGFAGETRRALDAYDWPGNVRELKNLVEAIFVAPPSREVRLEDLPDAFRARLCASTGSEAERRRLLDALLAANWNKSRAASMLHWSRMTVYRKMAQHSIVRSTDSRRRRRG